MRIDVHSHLYPKAYMEEVVALRATNAELARWTGPAARAVSDPRYWSVEQRLEVLPRRGVDLEVLSLPIPNAYLPDREAAVSLTQMANDYYIELARKYPQQFRLFASVPLHFPEDALGELARVADAPEVVGVALGSNAYGKPLDSPEFMPFYAELERRELPFFIHPACCTPGIEVMGDYNLGPMAGYLMDSSLAILRLVFSGVFERHPRLGFIMPHLGAMVPYILGRVEHMYDERADLRANIPRPPIEYFKRFYYDTVSEFTPAMRFACDLFGADHIVFGTDYPFWDTVDRVVQSIEEVDLSAEARDGIYADNARCILPKLTLI